MGETRDKNFDKESAEMGKDTKKREVNNNLCFCLYCCTVYYGFA